MKLYERLVTDLKGLIDGGTLRPGDRLPSVRKLTRSHNVSPGTVLQAYGVLEDSGWVEARARSGYYVLPRRQIQFPTPSIYRPDGATHRVDVGELVFDVLSAATDRNLVPFGSAFHSASLYPLRALARSFAAGTRYLSPWEQLDNLMAGSTELRRMISHGYLEQGSTVAPDDIIITAGAMEGLNLCLQTVTSPGDVVAVESPAFYGALQAIEAWGLRAVEIPTDPVTGVDLDALESALQRHPIKACWFMTNFQNPLGSLMPEDSKRELVQLLTRHEVPLIEDDVYMELYFNDAPKPAKAFDTEGIVMHCSSYSKSLAPGYRVGWVAPGRYRNALIKRKVTMTVATSVPAQLAVTEYLKRGGYGRHLRQLRNALEMQQGQMLQNIARYFPDDCRTTVPEGGYFLWVELPESVDSLELHKSAMNAGISTSPGPMFSAQRGFRNCVRLNYGHPWDESTETAMRHLGDLIKKQLVA